MLSNDPVVAQSGVKQLAKFQEFGILCENFVQTTLTKVVDRSWAQREDIQADFTMIESTMKQALNKLSTHTGQRSSENPLLRKRFTKKMAEYLEAFFDAGDAVKRRKRANHIYRDLQNQRISIDRATFELQLLNKRQKGGWADEYITRLRLMS